MKTRTVLLILLALLLALALAATWNWGPIGAQGIETPTPSVTPTLVSTDEPSGNQLCSRGGEHYDQVECLKWLKKQFGIDSADACFTDPRLSPGTCCGGFPDDRRCVASTATPTVTPTTPPPSPSPSPSPTTTSTATSTATASPTPTTTATATATMTPTVILTASPSPTGTWEPTEAPTDHPTGEPTYKASPSPTPTMAPMSDFEAPRSGGDDALNALEVALGIVFIACLIVGTLGFINLWAKRNK